MIDEYGIKDMARIKTAKKVASGFVHHWPGKFYIFRCPLDGMRFKSRGFFRCEHKSYGINGTSRCVKPTNSRNGYSPKPVQSSAGEMEIQIPRDRNGEFESQLKKHQTDVSAIEEKVIFILGNR